MARSFLNADDCLPRALNALRTLGPIPFDEQSKAACRGLRVLIYMQIQPRPVLSQLGEVEPALIFHLPGK
jgi:hypothetical protein